MNIQLQRQYNNPRLFYEEAWERYVKPKMLMESGIKEYVALAKYYERTAEKRIKAFLDICAKKQRGYKLTVKATPYSRPYDKTKE